MKTLTIAVFVIYLLKRLSSDNNDLANFSLSKEDLQKRISILEQYSNEEGLELNLRKTKIMIFNKQGAPIRRFRFYFQGQEFQIVKRYTYLEFTFIASGKKAPRN